MDAAESGDPRLRQKEADVEFFMEKRRMLSGGYLASARATRPDVMLPALARSWRRGEMPLASKRAGLAEDGV